MCVREGRRERMMDMRWPTLPRDKIYTIMCEMIVCVFWAGRDGELEGGEWVCAGFFFWGGGEQDIVTIQGYTLPLTTKIYNH